MIARLLNAAPTVVLTTAAVLWATGYVSTLAYAQCGCSGRAGIARQRVCPVTGAALGSMGDPVKLLVGGQPLYLCCKGCLSKVQSNPLGYLQKANQAAQRR